MPVKIPVNLVPRAFVDYDMEQRQILGQPLVLSDGFRVPPLTAARLMALELVCSDFFLHPAECSDQDAAAAIVLVTCSRELVQDLTGAAPDAPDALASAASSWLDAHGDTLGTDYALLVRWILQVPFYGFDMRPKEGAAAPRPCWFDGEFLGGILAPAAKLLATPLETILWKTPLCVVGHAIAQQDASLGVKGVERPPDLAALKRLMSEAAAREKRGELHPWQYADPETHSLSAEQFKANPALGAFFEKMRADFRKNGRRPLDPAAYPLPPAPGSHKASGTSGPVLSVIPCASEAGRTLSIEVPSHV